MKKEKYRFTKAKEKYKAEHEGELRRFYMVKRKLKEKGFERERAFSAERMAERIF